MRSVIDQTAVVQQETAERRDEAVGAFSDLLEWVQTGAPGRLPLFEAELWKRMLVLGVALFALWVVRRRPLQVPRVLDYGKRRFGHLGIHKASIKTRFGIVGYRRDVYVSGRQGRGHRTVAPFDFGLGLLPGRLTLGVGLTTARIAVRLSFAETGRVLHDFLGYVPSTRAMLGIVDHLGPQARPFIESLPAPEDDGDVLVLMADGKGAPMITEQEYERRRRPHCKRPAGTTGRKWRQHRRREYPKERRTRGDKSKNAKVAVLGVLYTMRRTPDGWEGPIHKRVIGTFESHRALFEWLSLEARKRGYPTKPTYFLADGARVIWKLAREFFPDAVLCLDWYHVTEYLWMAGETVFKEGSRDLQDWVTAQKAALREGNVDAVLAAMRELQAGIGLRGPGTKGRRKRIASAIGYLENKRDLLRYKELLGQDLDIGTGAAEGAVRNVVGLRLDGPGMRWSQARAEKLLHLRCVAVSDLWEPFANYLEEHLSPAPPSRPPRLTPIGWAESHPAREARCRGPTAVDIRTPEPSATNPAATSPAEAPAVVQVPCRPGPEPQIPRVPSAPTGMLGVVTNAAAMLMQRALHQGVAMVHAALGE
jgi:hypothetical protein